MSSWWFCIVPCSGSLKVHLDAGIAEFALPNTVVKVHVYARLVCDSFYTVLKRGCNAKGLRLDPEHIVWFPIQWLVSLQYFDSRITDAKSLGSVLSVKRMSFCLYFGIGIPRSKSQLGIASVLSLTKCSLRTFFNKCMFWRIDLQQWCKTLPMC